MVVLPPGQFSEQHVDEGKPAFGLELQIAVLLTQSEDSGSGMHTREVARDGLMIGR